MLKQLVSTVLVGITLCSSSAFAADNARSAIHISATIPTQQFHVMPRDPEFGKNEVMTYNPVSKRLSSLRQTYDVKNTEGSIHAYVADGDYYLTNGLPNSPTSYILLSVEFNGVRLYGYPQEVVSDAASTPGTQAELTITSYSTITDHVGLYTGNVVMIFDAVPRITL